VPGSSFPTESTAESDVLLGALPATVFVASAVSAASICWRQVNLGDRLECYDLFRAICARLRFGDLSVWPICSSWHQA
jgi:hypothetical protein